MVDDLADAAGDFLAVFGLDPRHGDPRQIGLLSFLTPLLSTLGLLLQRGEWPGMSILLAALMIVGAAVLGSYASRGNATQPPEPEATPGI